MQTVHPHESFEPKSFYPTSRKRALAGPRVHTIEGERVEGLWCCIGGEQSQISDGDDPI